MEKTIVIIKPGTVQRMLIGEVIKRFEFKGLQLCGMKMIQLNEAILKVHYAHLVDKPFFGRIKEAMMATPVIVCCWKGLDAIRVVRAMAGVTNGRNAEPGTIRGDFSMSTQENIIHASDSHETAQLEIDRFFSANEIYDYAPKQISFLYAIDEL